MHADGAPVLDLRVCSPFEPVRIPIAAPFADVAIHIVQSPGVGQLPSNFVRPVGIVHVPGEFADPRLVLAEAVSRWRPRAASVLPLRLRRQAVFPPRREPPGFSLLLAEQAAELDGILPRDAFDRELVHIDSGRQCVAAPAARKEAGIVVHHLAILALRYLVLAEPEPTSQRHLDGIVVFAHLELACRAPAKLHSDTVAPPLLAGRPAFGEWFVVRLDSRRPPEHDDRS